MSPRRRAGSFYFDRILPGIGRIQAKAWTLSRRTFEARDRLLLTLYEEADLETLQGLKAGRVTIVEVLHARKRKTALDVTGQMGAPLWPTVERTLSQQAKRAVTLDRRTPHVTVEGYRKSWKALRAANVLPVAPKVAELLHVDWEAVERHWGRSPAHWNQLRRAVSRMLTLHLGEHHAQRVALMASIPRRVEVPREPDLSPEAFVSALEALSPHLRAPIVFLVGSGLRRTEAWQVRPDDLRHATHSIRVRPRAGERLKNDASHGYIAIEPALWPWVTAAVPMPVTAPYLLERWQAACQAVGAEPTTLHDLRHCFGQWAANAGVDEGEIQKQLRHKTRFMTAIYTARKNRAKAAAAVGHALAFAGLVPAPVPTGHIMRRKRGA